MIETLAGPGAGEVDDLTAATCWRWRGTARRPRTAQPLISWSWQPGGPTSTRRSRSTPRLPFTVPGCEHEEPIAGEGAPLVAEFCLAELGTVLGVSTTAAKKLVGHALELRHRLPRLWAQVQSGRVPAWRARSVAEVTIHSTPALTREAAAFVDAQVAAVAGRIGLAQLDRLVAEAIKRFDLAERGPGGGSGGRLPPCRPAPRHDPRRRRPLRRHHAARGRGRHRRRPRPRPGARPRRRALKALGSTASLDARRAQALGDLARTQTALDLAGAGADRAHLPAAREVVLHAHFDATLDDLSTVFGPTGRLEEGQRLVLLDQVKDWCADSRTKVTVKPVIDLNAHLSTPAYEVPDRIREQVILRDRTCVFPWCTRPARGCDIDHVVPHDPDADAEGRPQPGPTESGNLAALCRFHHRLKTHTAWRYRMTAPGASSGPHPTATATDATTPAPPRSTHAEPARLHPATAPTMTPPHTPPPAR